MDWDFGVTTSAGYASGGERFRLMGKEHLCLSEGELLKKTLL